MTINYNLIYSYLNNTGLVKNSLVKNNLVNKLREIDCIKYGDFTLKSGVKSNIYIDLRILISYPQVFTAICL